MTIEKRVAHLEAKINKWDERLKSLDWNMRHYAKRVMPFRHKLRENAKMAVATMKKIKRTLDRQRLLVERTSGGEATTILMVTPNQAAKLRKLAELNLAEGHKWKQIKNGRKSNERTRKTDAKEGPISPVEGRNNRGQSAEVGGGQALAEGQVASTGNQNAGSSS